MSENWLKKYRLTIKRPKGIRKSFDIIVDTKSLSDRTQKSIKTFPNFSTQASALEALNKSLKSKILTENDVEVTIKSTILPSLEKILNIQTHAIRDSVINETNQKVLMAFIKEKYSERKIIDRQRLMNGYRYALRILGTHSLASVEHKTLQKHWDNNLAGTAHRRYGRCINTLLRFIGRDLKLQLERNSHRDMRYPLLEEVFKIANYHDDENLKNLIITMFAIGPREGEAFAITEKSLRANTSVYIDAQIDRNLVRRSIKNHNKHNALIIPEGLVAIKAWAKLNQTQKNNYRFLVTHRIAEASLKVLGRRLSSHDMRHGYAVHLLDKGVPLDRVAQFLGDTLEVTQKHYTSFVASDYAINTLSNLLKA